MTDPAPDQTPGQPALAAALAEVDRHLATGGWDQPAKLYALVKTADLMVAEPELAERLGLTTEATRPELTSVEQESPPAGQALDQWLASIAWPAEVAGCALAQEVVTLPPSAEAEMPHDQEPADAVQWAINHPKRREVRMVVGVLRDGSRRSILRVRGTNGETPDDLIEGDELVPRLADALAATLED